MGSSFPSIYLKKTEINYQNYTDKRREFKKRAIPPQVLHIGNIVSDFMLPPDRKPGQSTEIEPMIKNIYKVEEIRNMSARLINILDGSERSLPFNRLTKFNLNHLAQIKFHVKSQYLENKFNKLYQNNKFLSPNKLKTWKTLLQTDNQNQSYFRQPQSIRYRP